MVARFVPAAQLERFDGSIVVPIMVVVPARSGEESLGVKALRAQKGGAGDEGPRTSLKGTDMLKYTSTTIGKLKTEQLKIVKAPHQLKMVML